MLMKRFDGGSVEAGNIFAVALRVTVEKMVRQKIDVLAAIAQRRDVDLDGIQSKQQGLTETARSGLRIHVGVGCREYYHVDAPGRGRAHAFQIPRFQSTQ